MLNKENSISISKAAVIYFILGIVWIFFSDFILYSIFEKAANDFVLWEISKGIAFIFVTTLIFYFILKSFSNKLKLSNAELKKANNLYKALIEQSTEGVFRFELKTPVSTYLPVNKQIELACHIQNYNFSPMPPSTTGSIL